MTRSLRGCLSLRLARVQRHAICAALALIVAGCGERTDLTGTSRASRPGTTSTSGSSSAVDTRLVGRWSRTLLLQDAGGSIHASRTTWRFGADASASRSVVASNLTFGLVDSVVTSMRWRTEGRTVILTSVAPGVAETRFEYRFDGQALVLGGLAFDRQ